MDFCVTCHADTKCRWVRVAEGAEIMLCGLCFDRIGQQWQAKRTCATCRFWTHYEVAGATRLDNAYCDHPARVAVITQANFGCKHWEKREEGIPCNE